MCKHELVFVYALVEIFGAVFVDFSIVFVTNFEDFSENLSGN